MYATSTGLAPCIFSQPPIVAIRSTAVLTSSSPTTTARVARDSALSRLGCSMMRLPSAIAANIQSAQVMGHARAWWNR